MVTSSTFPRGDSGGSIFGREHELGRLHGLVDGLPERGTALLLRGEAGVGKSTLLSAAGRRAEATALRVLRTTGVQSEAELPFAGLHQLLMPLLDRVDQLPAPQRAALLAAFGMAETPEAPDRFMIGLAVLELLSDAAERAPVLVVADDAQWLDPSTAGVLGFVARRVEHEPIGLLLAIRVGEADPFAEAGLPEFVLGGLADEAAGALLDAHGRGLAPEVRGRLLEEASGNPLALVELPVTLSDDELAGGSPLPAPLPLTARLERAFTAQADTLPVSTQALLQLASADDGGSSLDEILDAAKVLSGDRPAAEDLAPAVSAGLVEFDSRGVAFRHPLVRSAVHQTASLADRQAAHAALAEVLDDQPDRQVWQQAAALVGPNERVAGALEAAADRASRRGAVGTAIRALERSVELSEDGRREGQRLLQAAELAFETGRSDLARRLVREALRLDLSAAGRQRVVFMRHWFWEETTLTDADLRGIAEAAERVARGGDPATATSLLLLAAGRSQFVSVAADIRERILEVSLRLGLRRDDPRLVFIRAFAAPVGCGAEVIEALSGMQADGGGDAAAARLLGFASYVVGAYELSTAFLSAAVDALRAHGRIALLAQALSVRAYAYWGLDRWDLAASDADEGRRLSEEIGHALWATRALTIESQLAAVRGDVERTEGLAKQVQRVSLPIGMRDQLARVQWARGLAALGGGRAEEAYEHLICAFQPLNPAWHRSERLFMIGDLAEAARHADRLEEARALMPETEAAVAGMASPAGRVAVEYARTMLAGEEVAEELFERALGGETGRRPFARARLQLAFGAWLRRGRRVVESRAPLRAAREGFDALGAAAWSEQARGELRASGVESHPRERSATEDLTPQELQIARLAASGLSNREIGGRLFLSHRTVGAHLYRAFPKLGITSRGQLREVLDRTPS